MIRPDPIGSRTIEQVLRSHAAQSGDHVAIEAHTAPCSDDDQVTTITYAELDARADRVARYLREADLKPGARVGLYADSSWEWVIAWLATHRVGAVTVPVSTGQKVPELGWQADFVDMSFAVVGDPYAKVWAQAIGDRVTTIPITAIAEVAGTTSDTSSCESAAATPELASVIFTSGSTGRPKGVRLTHGNLVQTGENFGRALRYTPSDRVLHCFPLYQMNGGGALLAAPLLIGSTIVMVPRFSASLFSRQLAEYGCTATALNSTHAKMLLNTPESEWDRAHAAWRCQFALPIDRARHEEFESRFGLRTVDVYGMTETCGLCIAMPATGTRKPGALGLVVPGYELRIVDDRSNEVNPGEVGEILVRSANPYGLADGYLHESSRFEGAMDADGWFATGDGGFVDDEGFLHFGDRKKDMIKRAGFNISAAEVEATLIEYPAIQEAAVVSIADAYREEQLVAFVVAAGDAAVEEHAIRSFVAKQLSDHKVPARVVVVDALPLGEVGKIDKKTLRSSAEQMAEEHGWTADPGWPASAADTRGVSG